MRVELISTLEALFFRGGPVQNPSKVGCSDRSDYSLGSGSDYSGTQTFFDRHSDQIAGRDLPRSAFGVVVAFFWNFVLAYLFAW